MSALNRRALLRGGLAAFALAAARGLGACRPEQKTSTLAPTSPSPGGVTETPHAVAPVPPARLRSLIPNVGALGPADVNGIRLPPGFTSRVVARSGVVVPGSAHRWHPAPDGGATFAHPEGGWVYVSNAEVPHAGGVGALRFDARGNVTAAYPILEGTTLNCAGGPTPWNTWLSCEETAQGRVLECDPFGVAPPVQRLALGRFRHEAATVDLKRRHVYLTEDEPDGRFYRFTSDGVQDGRLDLDHGVLEAAQLSPDGHVAWVPLADPTVTGATPTRLQAPASTPFRGGEGLWMFGDRVYFATKLDNRIWVLDVATQRLDVLYDAAALTDPVLTGVDNLVVSASGDVLVAEDGGDLQVVAILPTGALVPLLQVEGQPQSEVTGPAFDPSGTRLYFSSQRGVTGRSEDGVTYEVTGPFHEPA